MEEFYNLSISCRQIQESLESITRYVNGLSFAIQDKFNILNFRSVVEDYQESLRIEDNFS